MKNTINKRKILLLLLIVIVIIAIIICCIIINSKSTPSAKKLDQIVNVKEYESNLTELTKFGELYPYQIELVSPNLIQIYDENNNKILYDLNHNIVAKGYYELKYEKAGFIKIWSNDNKCGLFNSDGKEIIPCKYNEIEVFSEKCIRVNIISKNNQVLCGIFDENGKEIVPCTYSNILYESDELLLTKKDDEYKAIDCNAKEIAKFDSKEWGDLKPINKTTLISTKDSKSRLVDLNGNIVLDYKYDEMIRLSENLIKAKLDGKWGVINLKGDTVLPFDNTSSIRITFYNNLIRVKTSSTETYTNMNGKSIITLQNNDSLDRVGDDVYLVKKSNEFYLMDNNGKQITKYKDVDKIESTSMDGLMIVKKSNKYGVIDCNENWIIQPIYKDIIDCGRCFLVENENNMGVYSSTGKEIATLEYNQYKFSSYTEKGEAILVGKNGKNNDGKSKWYILINK